MSSKIYLDRGLSEPLAEIIEATKPERTLLCTGRNAYKLSGAQKQVDDLLGNLDFKHYDQISANPKFSEIQLGIDLVKKYNPQLVLAVGGGSVIDTAKLLSSIPFQNSDPLSIVTGETQIEPKSIPLVAIPTTAGSGSEATQFSVVYHQQQKYSVSAPVLIPDYVVLAPELTHSMSPGLSAGTGLDAICQAIESIWAVKADQECIGYAEEALDLLLPAIRTAVSSPDYESRKTMQLGAFKAGQAINISRTTAAHAYSYTLTTHFGIPHGHAVAIFLPIFMELNAIADPTECVDPITREILDQRLELIFAKLGTSSATDSAEYFRQLVRELGLAATLPEVGIIEVQDLEMIARNVNLQRLGNHPIRVTEKDLVAAMR